MYSIGIDIGTTKICAVLRDIDTGEIVKTEHADNGAFIPSEKEWEKVQRVQTIVSRAFDVIGRIPLENVRSIGVTGQMHGIVYIDKNGKAVSDLYTWQDGRGAEYSALLGSPTGYGSVTHFYNKEHGLVPDEAVSFCAIHDYIVMLLTGREKPLTHSSDAASFGCYDIEKNAFTTDDPFYPEITVGRKIAGYYKNIPVSVAIGDNQAGFIGSGCGEDDVLVNVGTGAQVSMMTDLPLKRGNLIETRPLYDDKYILAGISLCGGRSLALLEKFFRDTVYLAGFDGSRSLFETIDRMLEYKEDTTLEFDNRFDGTRADSSIRGSISNISTENFTPADFAAGCVKGMAKELYDLYEKMDFRKTGRIIGSGNGIRKNKALIRYLESYFGMPIVITENSEEAALGAALFGEMCE